MRNRKIMRSLDRRSRFVSAALEGNHAAMKRLLAKGHDVNDSSEDGETAFSWCCQSNKLRSAQFLYKNGADINRRMTNGTTPLDVASCWASPGFRKWLKSVGGERAGDWEEWPWPPSVRYASPWRERKR
jgi:ankyrin repeat protein